MAVTRALHVSWIMLFEYLLTGQKVTIDSPIKLSASVLGDLGISEVRDSNADLPLFATSPMFSVRQNKLLLRIPKRSLLVWVAGNTADLAPSDDQAPTFRYRGVLRHPTLVEGLFYAFAVISAVSFLVGVMIAVVAASGATPPGAFAFARQFLVVGGVTFIVFAVPQWLSNVMESRAHARRIETFFGQRGVQLKITWT